MDDATISGLAFIGPILFVLLIIAGIDFIFRRDVRRAYGSNPPPTTTRPAPPPAPPWSAVPRPTHYTVYAPHHEHPNSQPCTPPKPFRTNGDGEIVWLNPHLQREDPTMARILFRTGTPGLRFRIEGSHLTAENTTNRALAGFITVYTDRQRVTQFEVPANGAIQIAQLDDPALGSTVEVILDAKAVHVRHDFELIESEPFITFADGSAIEIHTLRCRVDQYETREFVAVGTYGYAHKHLTEIMNAIPDVASEKKAATAKAAAVVTAGGKP